MSVSVIPSLLSGSTNGKPIQISATATLGNTIHTARPVNTANQFDQVWITASNTDTVAHTLTVEFGAAGAANHIVQQIPPLTESIVCAQVPINNSLVVTAFADTTNVINVFGFVNLIG